MRWLVSGGALGAASMLLCAGCMPHADYVEVGLRDPNRVRVELVDRSPFGSSNEKMVSLEEGEGGSGRVLPMRTGMLLDRYDAESRVERKDDGSLELQFERIPEDGAPPNADYSIRQIVWRRTPGGLRFDNAFVTQKFGTRLDSNAAAWRFDRASVPRLSITSDATFESAGFGDRIHPPSVVFSTSMENVRWAQAVTVESKSIGWWLLGASIFAAGLSAASFYLSGQPNDGPNGFFLATGVVGSSIGVFTLVFAIRALARGDRETRYDLVTPLP